jgi:SHAQKYF class myb-like DNA-binding protein
MNQSRYWTEAEHQRFLQAVRTFGAHNHKAIASFVATRSSAQVRSHSQKFFKKLESFRGQGLPSMTRKRKTLKDISMHQ